MYEYLQNMAETPRNDGRRVFHVISCHVLWRELCYYASLSRNIFTFSYLRQGLHNTPDILRKELQEAIDTAPDTCEAVLLGYGLCSNGISGIVARNKPIVVPRAHDCITFLLGSKERYRQYFDEHPGTYWYTPGWIDTSTQPGEERYARVHKYYEETYGEENAKYLMEMEQAWMHNYSNAAYADLGFGENEPYKAYTQHCADWLGWNCDFLEGDPQLVKQLVEGYWPEDAFLVVQPGEMINPSHDETIITVKHPDSE